MRVHLIDGTYELFRHYYGVPSSRNAAGEEVGAIRGLLGTVLGMIDDGCLHLGVATDHVIESFRNDLWPGYKTGEGIEPDLWRQFHPLEEALTAMGVAVWPMVEFEADDALASAAARAGAAAAVRKVVIWTPDKDLAQCVRGTRIVQHDRRARQERDADGVVAKFGVKPESIPDYLALMGDSADGFPGIPGWGAKSASVVLARYEHLEAIPERGAAWAVKVRGADRLAAALSLQRKDAFLFRDLATLRDDLELFSDPAELRWRGPTPAFKDVCAGLGAPALAERAAAMAARLA